MQSKVSSKTITGAGMQSTSHGFTKFFSSIDDVSWLMNSPKYGLKAKAFHIWYDLWQNANL